MAINELPSRKNSRGGPGWWMDLDGVWRAPEDWPEDTPPLDGWVRTSDGRWTDASTIDVDHVDNPGRASTVDNVERRSSLSVTNSVDAPSGAPRRSRQAESDRRAMLTVAGAAAAALLILGAAIVLMTQAGAERVAEPDEAPGPAVVFAAETDEVKMKRRVELAAEAPDLARAQLEALPVRTDTASVEGFDLLDWTAERTDCLDIAEQVLVERTRAPIVWADNLECVPDRGRWSDRYLGTTISRTIDADVTLHVPAAIAFQSGGAEWTEETRQSYLTDVDHPAVLEITSSGSGHNPRGAAPDAWKPSKKSAWCSYAIDWVAVKDRWELSVTEAELAALGEMLDTCSDPATNGPDLWTMPIDGNVAPTIERIASPDE